MIVEIEWVVKKYALECYNFVFQPAVLEMNDTLPHSFIYKWNKLSSKANFEHDCQCENIWINWLSY